jgi:hypothetical protein
VGNLLPTLPVFDFPSPAAMPSNATIMGEVGNQVFELRNS